MTDFQLVSANNPEKLVSLRARVPHLLQGQLVDPTVTDFDPGNSLAIAIDKE